MEKTGKAKDHTDHKDHESHHHKEGGHKEEPPKPRSFLDYFKDTKVRSFAIKAAVFLGIIILIRTLLLYLSYTQFFQENFSIPSSLRIGFLTGLNFGRFLNAIIFTGIVGIILFSRKVGSLSFPDAKLSERIIYGGLFVTAFVMHYAVLYMFKHGSLGAEPMIYLKYFLQAAYVVALALAIFGAGFAIEIVTRFYREIGILIAVLVSFSLLILVFESMWLVLSTLVAKTVGYLLSLTEGRVIINLNNASGPILGAKEFIVGVSAACSGIDSLQLFIGLFTGILFLDWNILDRKRMAILFIPGLIGTVLYNILRVYVLMLVGIYIDREFAINTFHTNAGWVFFLIFFAIFWHFGSAYAYRKDKKAEA